MNNPLVEFKRFYETFGQQSLDNLDEIYAQDVVFSDPVHIINGRTRLKSYFEGMCGNLTHCRFEFLGETIQEGSACYRWKMYYQHPSIKNNTPLELTGASFIEYSDKIDSHQDFYDMGAMLYEHLPVMGSAIRMIKSRITKEKT